MVIYLGYDSREKVAYDVCKYSIEYNTDLKVVPLVHKELRRQGWFSRPWMVNAYDGNWFDLVDGKSFSTEFSHTRFLVPALQNYKGWALFMDCDMVVDFNIEEIFEKADPRFAVICVKHNHKPDNSIKMDGCEQARYFRKNWSSFMLFNCAHPANKKLTKEYISTAPGRELHAFSWLQDHQIGHLDMDYNWIEGISPANIKPKVIHYTEGGPWFENYREVKHADTWWKYYERWKREEEFEPVKETISVKYEKN